ncbi:MAG: amidohydrolase family protein [Phycisphaerae bacterium]
MPTTTASAVQRSPANRLGIDYRKPPAWKLRPPLIDVHTHVKSLAAAAPFFEAADCYGVSTIISMTPLESAAPLHEAHGGRLRFIAIPNWRREGRDEGFRDEWISNLRRFRELGAQLCKFWMAPPMRGDHGLTLEHAFIRPVIEAALELDYEFMVHVGDPTVWWRTKYADTAKYGTKEEQYPPLRWFLRHVAPRRVIAAHMGGSIESPPLLQDLLDAHPNLYLDTSATKWIVREVAPQPDAVRAFVIRNADRVLFGSDLVVDERYDFEHYASRYWAQRSMWETRYRGESPIDDPDAQNPPLLAGVDLPTDVLERVCRTNATAFGM